MAWGVTVCFYRSVTDYVQAPDPDVPDPAQRLSALTTFELRDYRRELETAIAFFDRQDPVPRPVTGWLPASPP